MAGTIYDLAGKAAIVTGRGGGIGAAIAGLFLASGARVSLWDSSQAALEATMSAHAAEAHRLSGLVVDVTDADAIDRALAIHRALFGRVDILVNNAGILGPVAPLWEIAPADFRRVLEVDLTGAFLCCRAVLPVMRDQVPRPQRGHVVNISSIQGKEGMALAGAYSAAKAGLIALTRSAAKEVATEGIAVNCITPAAAETAMAKLLTPERRADILSRIPQGRFVTLDEIAAMTAWLASDECSFSTGAVFDLSGSRATY